MRKKFHHDFVTPYSLTDEIIDGKRYYTLPDGTKLKSVTTILGERTDKSGLTEWRQRVGDAEADKIMTQAAIRGTAIHTIAERYLLNEDKYMRDQMPFNKDTFKHIKGVLDEKVDHIMGIELPLWSKALKAAGRTDLVAHYNNIPSIIDFKTSRRLKKEEWVQNYFLQATTYSLMFEKIYGISIPQFAIIIAVDHEEKPQVFVRKRDKYIDQVIELFTREG